MGELIFIINIHFTFSLTSIYLNIRTIKLPVLVPAQCGGVHPVHPGRGRHRLREDNPAQIQPIRQGLNNTMNTVISV